MPSPARGSLSRSRIRSQERIVREQLDVFLIVLDGIFGQHVVIGLARGARRGDCPPRGLHPHCRCLRGRNRGVAASTWTKRRTRGPRISGWPLDHVRHRLADVGQPAAPNTATRSVEDVTRLRKCTVWRRVAAINAQTSSSDIMRPALPSRTWIVIRSPMFRSSVLAIVRAAFSETFDVSAASTRSRSIGLVRSDPLVRGQGDRCHRAVGEERAPRRSEIVNESLLLLELCPHDLAVGRSSTVSSSSPLTDGAVPPSSSARALRSRMRAV